jgi:hypothetical protein
MSINVNLHKVTAVSARRSGDTAWLHVECRDDSYLNMFMPYEVALAMAEAFERAMTVKPETEE